VLKNNQLIQNRILAMRPYGATPLAGLVDDAREYLFYDDTQLPGFQSDFGPKNDLFWQGGCRKTFMILLTDGEPNLDLRQPNEGMVGTPPFAGACDASGGTGVCPYDKAESILTAMRDTAPGPNPTNQSVTTYVVGFAVSKPAKLPAGATTCDDLDPAQDCGAGADPSLADCCILQKLAQAGGLDTDPVFAPKGKAHAFFADNASDLKTVLGNILSKIVGGTTARTAPVYSAAGGDLVAQGPNLPLPALSYHFAGTVNVTSASGGTGQWTGDVQRERFSCVNGVPTAQTIDPNLGDDYGANLNSGTGPARQFFTAVGNTTGSNAINSDWTIRPAFSTDPDGFGVYQTQPAAGIPLQSNNSFASTMQSYPAALGIKLVGDDPNCTANFGIHNNAALCATDLVKWEVGLTNSLGAGFSPAISRDPRSAYCTDPTANRQCSLLGPVYHSTPVVVGPPNAYLRDDTYSTYAQTFSAQPIVLYTATTDGQLHAFKVSSSSATKDTVTTDTKKNNEIWSFFPPAVLQHLGGNFNSGGANLLDGAPVVADVPGTSNYAAGTTPSFERTPTSSPVYWHRVLVAGSGAASAGAGGFYYALDVTDVNHPVFLWQISTDPNGVPLFGNITPRPAIGTVAITESNTRTQVAVAFLAGGSGTAVKCTGGNKAISSWPGNVSFNNPANPSNSDLMGGVKFTLTAVNTQQGLNCWQEGPQITTKSCNSDCTSVVGSTLTIVRLDTGQVIAHLMGQTRKTNTNSYQNVYTGQPFYAPLTGVPAVYPSDLGQVADRVYVGDADGQLWRFDLSNPDPTKWAVTSTATPIALAWDAYADNPGAVRDGIFLAPALSRDAIGNVTINIATGEQNMLTLGATDNRLWSLTELPFNGTTFPTSQNWMIPFSSTQAHVVGQMAIFNQVLYFSSYQPGGSFPKQGNQGNQGDQDQGGDANEHVNCSTATGNMCGNGIAILAAADYRRPADSTGLPMGKWPGTSGSIYSPTQATDGSVIYGVAATQLPSCGGTAATTDPYFGSHNQVTNANATDYRIMWQTGSGKGISGGGAQSDGLKGVQSMTVPPPGMSTRIDSWGAIVE
jgi:type IV pilus assembly protein PilY1